MDKNLITFAQGQNFNLASEVSLLETRGNVRPQINSNKLLIIGTWACALILSGSTSAIENYNITTTLNYPNKGTQAVIAYDPQVNYEDYLNDEEIDQNIFVKTKPERSYSATLSIQTVRAGNPIIDIGSNLYES